MRGEDIQRMKLLKLLSISASSFSTTHIASFFYQWCI